MFNIFKKNKDLPFKIGSIIMYQDKKYQVSKITDDNKYIYIDYGYFWKADETIVKHCILAPVSEIKVLNK